MSHTPSPGRYADMKYVRCGNSGLRLPLVSLGLWHNFGKVDPFWRATNIILKAFDSGITHFDLANNYGPPPGSAETNLGRIIKSELYAHRDELIISTKAGYLMWPGPYGDRGSRKYLIASLDQSLMRMGLDYVDIFYSHRFDPDTPLEETMDALASSVKSGKALYAGISNYPPEETEMAAGILSDLGCPCLIHQEKFSLLRPAANKGLGRVLTKNGIGCIAFSPLAQGILTDRYLNGIPEDSRAAKEHGFLKKEEISEEVLNKVRALSEIASGWGMDISDLALNWVRSHDFITSVLIGVSTPEQLDANLRIIKLDPFTAGQMEKINSVMRSTNN